MKSEVRLRSTVLWFQKVVVSYSTSNVVVHSYILYSTQRCEVDSNAHLRCCKIELAPSWWDTDAHQAIFLPQRKTDSWLVVLCIVALSGPSHSIQHPTEEVTIRLDPAAYPFGAIRATIGIRLLWHAAAEDCILVLASSASPSGTCTSITTTSSSLIRSIRRIGVLLHASPAVPAD